MGRITRLNKWYVIGVLFIGTALLGGYLLLFPPLSAPMKAPIPALYGGAGPVPVHVAVVADAVAQITHIEITPDGQYMLVATLQGTVLAFHKKDGQWLKQRDPFFTVKTDQPGLAREEAGLSGIILGADFGESGDVFFTYSGAWEGKRFKNQIVRVSFTISGGKITGKDPQVIFEANVPGTGSHQIQDGIGIIVEGKPHVLFTIGDGFEPGRSLDSKSEAGKIMLVQRDGRQPAGLRPFPENPRVQSVGIRNAPAIAWNTKKGKLLVADTGTSSYDRLLYGTLIRTEGDNTQPVSFGWDGTEDSLTYPVRDPYDWEGADMVISRWTPTETPVSAVFYENAVLPRLLPNQQYVLLTLFGRTGDTANTPGKQIALGTLTHTDTQNRITWEPLITRVPEGNGHAANPIGLAIDPTDKRLYFGDIMEGRIYQVTIGE